MPLGPAPGLPHVQDEQLRDLLERYWEQIRRVDGLIEAVTTRLATVETNTADLVTIRRDLKKNAAGVRQVLSGLSRTAFTGDPVDPTPFPPPTPVPITDEPPDRFEVVLQVHNDNPGLIADRHAFTQTVVLILHAEDARWGRRRNDSGTLSGDTAAFRQSDGVANPFSVDIIFASTGPNPQPQWNTVGRVGGSWENP